MSIIILAQSLNNSGTVDIQIDDVFESSIVNSKLINAFRNNCQAIEFEKIGNSGLEFGIEQKSGLNPIYGFTINCEEIGSLIYIQAKLKEINYVVQHLENFLQSRGRPISAIKMKIIKEKINFEKYNSKALINS